MAQPHDLIVYGATGFTGRLILAAYDELWGSWTGPFMMATIYTKNVHRTKALRGHPWGYDYCYDERLMTGADARGRVKALLLAGSSSITGAVGLLDRVAPLYFAAPVFFHPMRWYFQIKF